jgi:alcohol dehydrogenase, propanol-preferring
MQEAWVVVEHLKPLERIEIPIPEPTGKQVLIKVTHAGVCHSEVHFWEGYYDLGQGKKFYIKDRGVTLPRAPGHEIFGTVEKAGPEASDIEIGSARIVYPWIGCGTCRRCVQGDDNMCAQQQVIGVRYHGGFAQYVLVPDSKFLVDPGNVDPADAAVLGCSAITVLSAIKKIMPLEPEDPVLLIGAGGLGLSAIEMLKALGHKKIISADIAADKREDALKQGATAAIDSRAGDAVQQIQNAAGDLILGAIDFVGIDATASLAYSVLAKGGRMVGVGIMGGELKLSNVANILKAATVVGNYVGSLSHLKEVVQMANDGKLKPIPITTLKWEQAPEAFERLQQGKVTGRIVLEH